MEANIKENQLTFSKGMSNVPSDNLCDDNTLSDCIGMRMKDGELRPVQSPKRYGTLDGELLYVHKTTYRHLIYRKNGLLYWAETDEDDIISQGNAIGEGNLQITTNGNIQVTSIGNTLIVSTNNGLKYAVWRGDEYKVIDSLPEVSLDIRSNEATEVNFMPEDYSPEEMKNAAKILSDARSTKRDADDTEEESGKNEIIGLIEGAYKRACKNGMFTYPFWIRVALQMYDGSYAMISNPVLAMPTVRNGAFVVLITSKTGENKYSFPTLVGANYSVKMEVKLETQDSFDYLEDIVENVSIFISDQVKTWEEGSKDDTTPKPLVFDTIRKDGSYYKYAVERSRFGSNPGRTYGFSQEVTVDGQKIWYYPPYCLTDSEIIDKLVNTSVFYKVAEIKPNSNVFETFISLDKLMKRNTLENITTQEQLPHDDYYGHCRYRANCIYAFNSRLQIADIERIPYDGCYHFTSRENTNTMSAVVRINGRDGYMYVSKAIGSYNNETPVYFYYPDPNADYVYFSNGTYKKLSPHPRLNGAYFFDKLPPDGVTSDGSVSMVGGANSEYLNTTIMTSEVNNPWVFNAEGSNTIGTGEIVGAVANATALSQGQFGQHPLIVFTTEGIYALGTNSEGLYSNSYPLSREVCNNAKSITPTDGAVFFTSEKGLMMMVGSQITCVSQQMMGKGGVYDAEKIQESGVFVADKDHNNGGFISGGQISDWAKGLSKGVDFKDYLKNCIIAYDYKGYCLNIINKAYDYYYIYDIKSGAFTRNVTEVNFQRVVNDYPDNLIQDNSNVVWSLIKKEDPNDDNSIYNGMLLSRPVKFSSAQTLKSIREMVHVKDVSGQIETHIYVSNDLKNWGEVKSLRGSGWKYYRFGIRFLNLRATDSYSGMLCITQNRRTNKLR